MISFYIAHLYVFYPSDYHSSFVFSVLIFIISKHFVLKYYITNRQKI